MVVEIRLILNNKGFVQHTVKKLELSVLGDNNKIEVKQEFNDVVLKERIFKRQTIVPEDWYFWVRPGVKQVFTKIIKIDKKQSIIRITASFSYGVLTKSRHTARRVFEAPVPQSEDA